MKHVGLEILSRREVYAAQRFGGRKYKQQGPGSEKDFPPMSRIIEEMSKYMPKRRSNGETGS